MGLNLARNLVALHGGILSAEPLPGGGSKVSFVIPPEPQEKPGATAAPQQPHGEQDREPPAETGRDEAEEPSQREIAIDADEGDTMEQLRELQRRLAQLESRAHQS
jgi:hypothetical protein